MTIQKLDDFAENGDKNLTGIDVQQGFVQAEKPARQWFNSLFNSTIKKVNEVITALEALVIGTDKIADGAVTTAKLANESVTGDKIEKDTELNTPKLSATYTLTTLDAPNLILAADGTLKRSNDPLNASTRKVGTAAGNLVERDADGYPVNNNAIGVGQTWQDMTASRVLGTTYTNSSGKTIVICVSKRNGSNSSWAMKCDGLTVRTVNGYGTLNSGLLIIPNGSTYSVGAESGGLLSWWELR